MQTNVSISFETCTINQFMDCWFKNKHDIISVELFKEIYSQYCDVAQLYQTYEFEKTAYIFHLQTRIQTIRMAINAHIDYYIFFGKAYEEELDFFIPYGHRLVWKKEDTKEEFFAKLNNIRLREVRYGSELRQAEKELADFRSKRQHGEHTTVAQNRNSFLKMLATLQKIGWKIDRSQTTMEELAIINCEQKETVEDNQLQSMFK